MIKKFMTFLLIVIGLAGLLYAGLAFYYGHGEKKFLNGTVINDVYCTGMNVDEVNTLLKDKYICSDFNIQTRDGLYTINSSDLKYDVDFSNELLNILKSQRPYMWLSEKVKKYDIDPDIIADEALYNELFDNLGIENNEHSDNDVSILLTENGYVLSDNKKPVLNYEYLKSSSYEALCDGLFEYEAGDAAYTEFVYTAEEKSLISLYEKLDKYQNRTVKYVFGNERKLISPYEWSTLLNIGVNPIERITPQTDVSKYITFEIDREKAIQFINNFLDEYNTYHNRYFLTHSGEVVHVTTGNYGNKLNIAKEEEWFCEFVNSDSSYCVRTPEYLISAKFKEKNDFGDTFIEISLDEQHMWYYVDGEIYVDTPITSGSMVHGGTDPRVVYVYTKIPNKWLNGPTWHSFVKYWVAIQGAIGIHDASWRSVYGGDEYKYNGSHGCINTPLEAMSKLYDKVEIGTPVIVYSLDKNGVEKEE